MGRSRHTERTMGSSQDRASWSVAPEVLRTSGGADEPAVVASTSSGAFQRLFGLMVFN